jgi:hypothetical protein
VRNERPAEFHLKAADFARARRIDVSDSGCEKLFRMHDQRFVWFPL